MKSLLVIVLMITVPAIGIAKMYEEPKSFSLTDKSLQEIDRKIMRAIDAKRLLEEDREHNLKLTRKPGPMRFAIAEDATFNLANSGTLQDLPDGRLWRLRIHTPGAASLNLGITRFDLPEGGKLWVYDPKYDHIEGPYTRKNRNRQGGLWTPMIEGDEIVVELFIPAGSGQPTLLIGKVNKGYRGFGKVGLLGSSEGTCNIDVVCPEGNPWPNEIRSILAYTINGTSACTGNLVNNTVLDFRPYVLSANHCGVNTTNDGTIVAFFNFQSATCGTHGPGSTTDNQTGATFRASSSPSDFLLFELDATPDPSFNIFYAGWDRSGVAPPGVACIHHPRADVKAISFGNTPPLSTAYFSDVSDPTANHWRVAWDVVGPNPPNQTAITEAGSSGSCIFASDTHRCIGQLHGGPSSCGAISTNLNDFYGKFSVSWTGGGTNSTRLSDWLDPTNSGAMGLDGDPHITTLDGTHYDFQGAGEFVAFRAGVSVEVQVRQAPISTTFNPGANPYTGLATCVSLNTGVAARVGKHRLSYLPNLNGVPDPSGLQLRVDGKLTTLPTSGIDLDNGARVAKTSATGGLQVLFPEGYTLTATPDFWTSQGKWYLNVAITRTSSATAVSGGSPVNGGTGGLAGAIAAGSWLPSMPDGSALGPMPPVLHDRYVDLYQKFGEAWRVTKDTSLFDYAPGTSTDTFAHKNWPSENPPCTLSNTTPVKSVSLKVAQEACRNIVDRRTRANCVFDVQVTGERGFARTYLNHERVMAGTTTISLRDYQDPTHRDESISFVATVALRSRNTKRVPKGTVEFLVDGERASEKVRVDTRGRAVWKTGKLAAGTHTIVASYAPTPNSEFSSATSEPKLHVVTERH